MLTMISVPTISQKTSVSCIDDSPFRVLFWRRVEIDAPSAATLEAILLVDVARLPLAVTLAADGRVALVWNEGQNLHATTRAEVVTLGNVCHPPYLVNSTSQTGQVPLLPGTGSGKDFPCVVVGFVRSLNNDISILYNCRDFDFRLMVLLR